MIRISTLAVAIGSAAALAACATTEGPMAEAPMEAAPAAPAASPAMIAAGGDLFNSRCTGCHRDGGNGPAPTVLSQHSVDHIVAALSEGGVMARMGANLSGEQRTAIATYLTNL